MASAKKKPHEAEEFERPENLEACPACEMSEDDLYLMTHAYA